MVDCEGLNPINNLYAAVKEAAHTVKPGVGSQASPEHADAGRALALHAAAAAAEAIHAAATPATACDAGFAAAVRASHAGGASVVEAASALHADAVIRTEIFTSDAAHAGASIGDALD